MLDSFLEKVLDTCGQKKVSGVRIELRATEEHQIFKAICCEKSSYVGVSWHGIVGKWEVRRCAKGKQYSGGCFSNELEAARKSDELALEIGGKCQLNFPNESKKKKKPQKEKKKSAPKPRERDRVTSNVVHTAGLKQKCLQK